MPSVFGPYPFQTLTSQAHPNLSCPILLSPSVLPAECTAPLISSPLFSPTHILNLAGISRYEGSPPFGNLAPPQDSENPLLQVPERNLETSHRRERDRSFQEDGHPLRVRKKRKHLKRHNNKHLSLGIDIDMDEVVPMVVRLLVGKVQSRPWGYNALYRWMQES